MRISLIDSNPDAIEIELDAHVPFVSEVLWFDYSRITHPGYHAMNHLHHFHQLDVVLDGEFQLLTEDREPQAGMQGDAWIIPPLTWHAVDCPKPFYYCSFKFHLTPRFWPLFGTSFQRFQVSPLMMESIHSLGTRCKIQEQYASQQTASIISLCLIEFLDQVSQVATVPDSLDEFRHQLWPLLERIQNQPGINWSVQRLANELNLSVDYFSRCFRRIVGQTPQRYVLETTMRVSAARLLEIPYIPIKEIAERASYANVHAFTKAFSQVFKISPAAYRRQVEQRKTDVLRH